jgi:hypothetical protein
MVEPLRHRQTKEAATDMFYLKPPRHISTLPIAPVDRVYTTSAFPPRPDISWHRSTYQPETVAPRLIGVAATNNGQIHQ